MKNSNVNLNENNKENLHTLFPPSYKIRLTCPFYI